MDSDSDDGSVSSHNSDEQKKTGEYKPDLTSEDAQRARGIISFLFEPSSSLASHIYHLAAAALVLCHVSD